jgi:signal transduction histidine kinase
MSANQQRDAQRPTKPKVLVIFADGDDGAGFEQSLTAWGGQVTRAKTAADAWTHSERQEFHLAYLDLTQNSDAGLALLRQLRSHPRTRWVPVIAVCRCDDLVSLGAALDDGASAFLTKPINWQLVVPHAQYVHRLSRQTLRKRYEHVADTARLHAREVILGNACGETLAATRLISGMIDKALTSRPLHGQAAGLTAAIKAIDDRITLIHRLVEEAMTSARETRPHSTGLGRCEIADLIGSAVAAVGPQASTSRVALHSRVPDDAVLLTCDPESLEQAVVELLRNAITHSPAGSGIDVDGHAHADGMVTISITDRGIGMSPDFVTRCLAPLAADVDYTAPRPRIGTGLPTAKSIAEAHGGTLELRTSVRSGTCAMLVIPAERVLLTGMPRTTRP